MNTITKINDNLFELKDELGNTYECKLWFEKKTNEYHIKLPMNNSSGRQYIRLKKFNENSIDGVYEFETKDTPKRVLNVSNWKSVMTDSEKTRYKVLEDEMEKIKSDCIERLKSNSEEMKLQRQIEKLQSELNRLRGLE